MSNASFGIKLLIEFLGTAFLVMTIKLAVSNSIHDQNGQQAPFAIATVLMIWIYVGGKISGGQYNPGVALGCYLRGLFNHNTYDFTFNDFLCYVITQFLGGIMGGLLANAAAGIDHYFFEIHINHNKIEYNITQKKRSYCGYNIY
jgi:glycerol uptake facilitator-like aquaporin